MAGISQAQADQNKLTLAAFLEQTLGFTPAGAAGFLGNTQAESGFNPAASGTESNGLVTMGFQQWEGNRRTALQALAKASGKSESDPLVQEQLIYNELTQSYPSVLAAGRTATDPATYANIVNRQFENSGDYTQNRESYATAIYAQITGAKLPNPTFSGGSVGGAAGGSVGDANTTITKSGGIASGLGSIGADTLNVLTGGASGAAIKGIQLVSDIIQATLKPENWLRFGLIFIGLTFVIIGVNHLTDGDLIESATSPAPAEPTVAQQPMPISVTVQSDQTGTTVTHTRFKGDNSPYGKTSKPRAQAQPAKPAKAKTAAKTTGEAALA